MSAFLTPVDLRVYGDDSDGKWMVINQPIQYQSDVAGKTFTVPVGFITDLASVPRLPIVYLLTGDTSREAAVIHDYLYSTHEVDRKTADAVLREASAVTGVPAWRRTLMWLGVRIGGGGPGHWGADTKAEQEQKYDYIN